VGCTIGDPWAADVVAKIRAPTKNEVSKLRAGQILFSYIYPRQDEAGVCGYTGTLNSRTEILSPGDPNSEPTLRL